jgi:hypothetical protein
MNENERMSLELKQKSRNERLEVAHFQFRSYPLDILKKKGKECFPPPGQPANNLPNSNVNPPVTGPSSGPLRFNPSTPERRQHLRKRVYLALLHLLRSVDVGVMQVARARRCVKPLPHRGPLGRMTRTFTDGFQFIVRRFELGLANALLACRRTRIHISDRVSILPARELFKRPGSALQMLGVLRRTLHLHTRQRHAPTTG